MTVGEMPSHGHSISISSAANHWHRSGNTVPTSGDYYNAYANQGYDSSGDISGHRVSGSTSGSGFKYAKTSDAGSHGHTISLGNTGSGTAQNNMQPYIGVYVWQRSA